MSDKHSVELSAIVPILNEQENLEEVYERLTKVLEGCVESHEIIFVDDGSWDRSYSMMLQMRERDPRVKIIKFSRNFGQHPALSAGFRLARGRGVVCIDGDLQNPPEDIPRLLEKLREGYEVVYGHRVKRSDPLLRKVGSSVLYWLLSKTSFAASMPKGIPFSATSSSFRMLSHNVVQVLNHFEERTRFLASMTTWLGFKSVAVEVRHVPRQRGSSKYHLFKLIMLALDSITGLSSFPLKIASATGLVLSGLAMLFAAWITFAKLVLDMEGYFSGYALLLLAVVFLGGLQLLFLGILGEYLARVHKEVQGRPLFVVDHVVGDDPGDIERVTHTHESVKPVAGSHFPERQEQ